MPSRSSKSDRPRGCRTSSSRSLTRRAHGTGESPAASSVPVLRPSPTIPSTSGEQCAGCPTTTCRTADRWLNKSGATQASSATTSSQCCRPRASAGCWRSTTATWSAATPTYLISRSSRQEPGASHWSLLRRNSDWTAAVSSMLSLPRPCVTGRRQISAGTSACTTHWNRSSTRLPTARAPMLGYSLSSTDHPSRPPNVSSGDFCPTSDSRRARRRRQRRDPCPK